MTTSTLPTALARAEPLPDDAPHVLVVDDDHKIRELLTSFLMRQGFRITSASDTEAARAAMRGLSFDLVLLDVMMPGQSGLEFARELKASSTIPICMLTARSEAEERIAVPSRAVAGLALLMIAATTISTYTMNYVATYAQHTLGLTPLSASLCTVVYGLAAMTGALVGGRLSDRIGRKPVLLMGGIALMLLGVPCFFIMLLSPTVPVVALAAGVMAFWRSDVMIAHASCAAAAADEPPGSDVRRRQLAASRAKARASEAALKITREAIQLHGAIGFTDDCDAGLFLKRAVVLSAWLGNAMQSNALNEVFRLERLAKQRLQQAEAAGDENAMRQARLLVEDWRRLTTSDHFYYMSTKYWADGDVHKYFSPYESPYDAYINYMNVLDNLRSRAMN